MSEAKRVALLDANVLFSFRTRDILLRFHHAGLFQARLSAEILREWHHAVVSRKPMVAESLASQRAAIQRHFPECFVEGYEPLIPTLVLPDPDDRHVLAAAIHGGAEIIVTENLRDFPKKTLAPHGLQTQRVDLFLVECCKLDPETAVEALAKVRAVYRRPAYSPQDFVEDLRARRLPKLAAFLGDHIQAL